MSSRRSRGAVAIGLALLVLACTAPGRARAATEEVAAPGEAILEGRLLAPCCWTQTLDVHESELASSLRREIRHRLTTGEAATAIEDDLANRYGDRIRAAPKGGDVRVAVPIATGILAVVCGIGLCLLLFRWTRRASADPDRVQKGARRRDEYDARIDDALRDLDG